MEPLDPPAAGRLGEIQAPTLVIVGDADTPDALANADTLAAGIPGARKVVLPNVAHMVPLETPEAFNRLVLDFLGGL
jgi:pimeloyl-ACP methyl ester carboxylesterase